MNKKVLFVVPSLRNGGTISALKNILPALQTDGLIIDVFPITNEGPNYEYIAKYANVIGRRVGGKSEGVQRRNIKDIVYRWVFQIVKWTKKQLCKVGYDISEKAFKQSVRNLQKNNYDLIIAFQEGQPTRYASLFENVKKIAWVRCDYSNMLKIINAKPEHKLYSHFNQIVCVSEYTKNVFVNLLPETKDKTIALHNIMNTDRILNGSSNTDGLDGRFACKDFRIVSLGRIDPVKQFSRIPQIAAQLVEQGYLFKWFILGGKASQEEYDLLLDNISKYKMEGVVILLGEKNNPYPYIKQADLMVCTSLSEACPNVINEAKILHTPIVSTDFGSAKEFITNGVEGFMEPIESIAEKISLMIKDKQVYHQIANNLSVFKYDNEHIIGTLKQIICQ